MAVDHGTKPRHTRADIRRMLIIGAVAAAVGIAIGVAIDWFPVAASTQAKQIDQLYLICLVISIPIFVGVLVLVLFSVWKFRMRPGEELKDGPPIHGDTKLEVFWTAIPAVLLAGLVAYAYVALTDIEKSQPNTLQVRVVAEQFTWTFYYPDAKGKEVVSPQLYLPSNRPVKFTVQSKDVLHSFWVPTFRLKIDAVPGIDTSVRVTTNSKTGNYAVVCAELCGLGHSVMRQTAHVIKPAAFDKWLATERAGGKKPPAGGGGGAAADGKTVFTKTAPCASCHALKDAGSTGAIGPDLDKTLKGQSKAEIREAIVDPDAKVTKGYQPGIMPPNFKDTLKPAELDALVNYLFDVAAQ